MPRVVWRTADIVHAFVLKTISQNGSDIGRALSLCSLGLCTTVAEFQIRVVVLNRYIALGIPVTGPVG